MRKNQRILAGVLITLVLLSVIPVTPVYAKRDKKSRKSRNSDKHGISVEIETLEISNLGGGDDVENDLYVEGEVEFEDDDAKGKAHVTLYVKSLDTSDKWKQTKKYKVDDGEVEFEFLWFNIPVGDYTAQVIVKYKGSEYKSIVIEFDPPGGGPGPMY